LVISRADPEGVVRRANGGACGARIEVPEATRRARCGEEVSLAHVRIGVKLPA